MKHALLSPSSLFENPTQSGDTNQCLDGDLPTRHMALVKQMSIEGHQNAENYFFRLIMLLLVCFYALLISNLLENPKYDCYDYSQSEIK